MTRIFLYLMFIFSLGQIVAQVPQITTPPAAQTATEGQNVQFMVAATGTGLNYQWLRDGSILNTDSRVSGTTTSTLTILGARKSDEGLYSVVVSVSGSPELKTSSDGAQLKVNPKTPEYPQITQQPKGKTAYEGYNTQLTIVATGQDLEYQWTKNGSAISNGGRFSGSQSATLTISSVQLGDEGNYSATITVLGFPNLKVTSDAAFLKVSSAPPSIPVISQQPTNQRVAKDLNVQFKVRSEQDGLSYQWYREGKELKNDGRITGVDTSDLAISRVRESDAGVYYAIVANADFPSLWISTTEVSLAIVVPPLPEIDIQQPKGSKLVDSRSKKSFGTVKIGKLGNAKTFTIKNLGSAKLTGLGILRAGSHPKDFLVSKPLKASLSPGESTTFKVTFKPTRKGDRNAWIRIRSNDANENPFDIKLTGLGVKP